MTYFACFGYWGMIGLLLSCTIIAFCGTKALLAVKQYDIADPHTFNKAIAGKTLGRILTILCGLFSYCAYIVVLAGMKQISGSFLTVIIVTICAYAVLYKGFGALSKICGIFAPALALCIAAISVFGAFFGSKNGPTYITEYRAPSATIAIKAILYSGYNVLTSVCMFGRCGNLLKTKKNAIAGGILGGVMLLLSGSAILFGMVYSDITPDIYEMPIIEMFFGNAKYHYIVIILIFMAMFLSALTGLTGTCIFFTEFIPEKQMGIILGLAAIPATYISFGSLMDFIYPIFGFAGIFLIIILAQLGNKKV